MFRRKFIDRLRNKYQFGGARRGLSNPYLTLQGKSINTSEGQRFGAGAKMSAPLLESRNYGKNTSGLRFETDFAGTNAGPISMSNKQKAYNAAIGLRGFHNRYLNRDNSLSLNSNIGAGIGTGDSTGDNEMNPFVDANVSLLKSGRTKKGTNVSGGVTGSYGTEGSSNQGLRLGLKGNYGRLSGNVGYDFTNKTPRAGVSLNFQTGGVKYNTMDKVQDSLTVAGMTPGLGFFPDALNTVISAGRGAYNYATGDTERANSQMGDLALNAASMIPAAGQAAAGLKLAKTANKINKVIKPVKGVKKAKAAYNLIDATNAGSNLLKSTAPTNNAVGIPLRNTAVKPTNSFMPTSMSNNFAETGGMRQYQGGGVALPGGEMQPIPGSDAVQFNGQSHDQGGIMVDSQTEVEGGETMDKVNIAKKGGKRDYFFSSHLKEGGRSYADMHKDILADGGSQEEINMLAKMQEVAAGRDPKKVAKLGGIAKYQSGGAYPGAYTDLNLNPADPTENFVVPQNDPFNYLNVVPQIGDKVEVQSLKDAAEIAKEERENNGYVVKTPEELLYEDELKSLEEQKKIEAAKAEYAKLYNKANKKAKKGRGVPTEAYVGMGAQLVPSLYAFLHKQKKPTEATFTQGFKTPINAQTVKAQKLDRVNYNDKRSQLSSSIRGANKFIETSGGGPANMANLQATLAKDIMGQMQINAEETKANIAIDNREKQLAQQVALDNVKRGQAASTMNAQLARIEAARRDQIAGSNVTAQNQFEADQELNKMNALTSAAQGIAGGAGDIMSYKANERMARAIGSEGIYERDIMRDFIGKRAEKDGIPGLCGPGECTDKQINSYIANKGVFQQETEEAKMGGLYKYHAGGLYHNINHKKKSGTSKSKKNSTVSSKAWRNMKAGFPK